MAKQNDIWAWGNYEENPFDVIPVITLDTQKEATCSDSAEGVFTGNMAESFFTEDNKGIFPNPAMVIGETPMEIVDGKGAIPLEKEYATVSVSSEDGTKGNVSITPEKEEYEIGSTVSIEAIPQEGYEFVGWNYNHETGEYEFTNNPLSWTVDENKEFVGYFEAAGVKKYTITIGNANPDYGDVHIEPESADDQYESGEEIHIYAENFEGYKFYGWNYDGQTGEYESTDPNIWMTVESDKDFIAYFGVQRYYVSVGTNDENRGTVRIEPYHENGLYEKGETITIIAESMDGYKFFGWNWNYEMLNYEYGGYENQSMEWVVTGDKEFSAWFDESEFLNIYATSNNPKAGMVSIDPQIEHNTYESETEIQLSASSIVSEASFMGWNYDKETGEYEYDKMNWSFVSESDKTCIAYFQLPKYEVMVETMDVAMGTVTIEPESIDGQYEKGQMLTISAIPNEGYEFTGWNCEMGEEVTCELFDKTFTVEVNETKDYIAYFKPIEE